MSKPTSVAPSPTSQQNLLHAPSSNNHRNDVASDGIVRVSFSQSNSLGNHVINFSNPQKNNSVDAQDGLESELEQPLLIKPVSKSS